MPIASAMADDANPEPAAEGTGAPRLGAKNVAIDPELVKLSRPRPKIGALTAAGVLFLSVFFLFKLNADRRFAGNSETPATVTVADLASDKVDEDAFVAVQAEPHMAHAIRAQTAKNSVGLRVVPAKGSNERVWIVLPGDGWSRPTLGPYVGRVRDLADLPFAGVLHEFLAAHPRPVFATATAVRAGFSSGKVATVGGDELAVQDGDKIGFDVVEPNAAIVVGTYNERLPDRTAWAKALADAGITVTGTGRDDRERVFFDVVATAPGEREPGATEAPASGPEGLRAATATKLEAAGLWAARVDSVTHHHETTWRALKQSGPAGVTVAGITIPDAQLDLIGLYVVRDIPSGAVAVITGESPQDYWYVLPIVIVVGLIALVFAWALIRAIRRDFLAPKLPADASEGTPSL